MRSKDTPTLTPSVEPRRRSQQRRDGFAFLAGLAASAPFAVRMLDPGRARRASDGDTDQHALPLLVFVIPADPNEQHELGALLGAYLNFGSDEELAPLAVVEVVCVAEDELPAPDAVEGQGPYRVRFIQADAGAGSREVCFTAPEFHYGFGIDAMMDEALEKKQEKRSQQRTAALAAAVRQAVLPRGTLGPAWPALAPRAAAQRDAIANIQAGMPVAEAALEPVAPALLAAALKARGSAQEHAMHALAELVRARLVRGVVPGAEWAVRRPCDIYIEARDPEEQLYFGYACGMAYVPEQSRRFLYFYTMKRSERRRNQE